jgi:hypothetical protein
MIDFTGYPSIPAHVQSQLTSYVVNKVYPGGFVAAVLSNDLAASFRRADSANLKAMAEIVSFVYNEVPSTAWGSEEKMHKWCDSANYEQLVRNAEGAVDDDSQGC